MPMPFDRELEGPEAFEEFTRYGPRSAEPRYATMRDLAKAFGVSGVTLYKALRREYQLRVAELARGPFGDPEEEAWLRASIARAEGLIVWDTSAPPPPPPPPPPRQENTLMDRSLFAACLTIAANDRIARAALAPIIGSNPERMMPPPMDRAAVFSEAFELYRAAEYEIARSEGIERRMVDQRDLPRA